MKNLMTGALALALLAGCTAQMPVETPPIDVTYTQKAASQGIVKFANPTLRTQRFGADGKRSEISGVACKLQGSGFNASYTTPAIVRIPMKAGPPSSLVVTCNDGTNTRTQSYGATNLTAQRIQNSGGVAGGLVGALIASAIVASRDTSKDEFEFTSFIVTMNEKPQ